MTENAATPSETPGEMSLADPKSIYSVCFWFFESLVDVRAECEQNKLSAEEATQRTTDLAQTLYWILEGKVQGFAPAPNWTGAPMEKWLLVHFANELAALPPEEHDHMATQDSIVMFAISLFMQELLDAMQKTAAHDDALTQPDAKSFHLICKKWAEIFLGQNTKS